MQRFRDQLTFAVTKVSSGHFSFEYAARQLLLSDAQNIESVYKVPYECVLP